MCTAHILHTRCLCFAALAALACAAPVRGRDWFVATNGSDAADGSLAAPFRTLSRGTDALAPGDTLYLRGGTYRETLQPRRSGTEAAPLLIAAYSNEAATLSACDALAGLWSALSNGVYSTDTAWTLGSGYDQLFADGTMLHEARHPDHDSPDLLEPATAALTVSSNHIVSCTAFDGKGDLTGARFYAGVGSSWAWQNALVASNTPGTLYLDPATASAWWWPNYANKSSDAGRGFLYGHPNLLDADGEWLLQTNAAAPHTLRLRLAGGASPDTRLVELKRRAWCVDIDGYNHITVSNLALRAGAVRLNGTGLRLVSCDSRHASHFLVFKSGGATNGGRTEGGGVVVSGTSNTVAACTITDTAGSGILVSGTGHRITRNRVFNTDYSATYAACLVLSGTGHTADFNTLHDTGRDILRPTGRGLRVLFNDLYYAGRLCKDLGAVYAWGTDGLAPDGSVNRIAYNWIHDSTPSDPLGMGIYIDNYSRNFQIDHNVVWNFGIQQTQTWSDGVRLNAPAESLRLFHNTVFRGNTYNRGTFTPYQPGLSTPDSNYWTPTNHHLVYTAQNNLFMTNSAHELVDAASLDFRPRAGSPTIDPPFAARLVAWETTNGVLNVPPTYRLSMRFKNQRFRFEEADGVGVPLDTDGDGFTDPFVGATPDSGAYEYGAPYWVPGADGWLPEQPGARTEQPLAYVGDVVTARGTLVSSGSAPTTLLLVWGEGDTPGAWTNAVCLGDAFTGTFQPLLVNLTGLRLYTAYGYRFLATNAFGVIWSPPVTFVTGSGLPQSATWDAGAGTNLALSAESNWSDDAIPDLNGATYAHFGTGGSTARVDRAAAFYGLIFNSANAFCLAGDVPLTLRHGGIAAAAPSATARTYTLAAPLTLTDHQLWSVTNSSGGATTLSVTAPISDTALPCGLVKIGNGTVILGAANAYRGETVVSNGTLAITHAAALGAATGGTVVRATQGGCLEVSGGLTVAEPLTLNGERPNSGYSLLSSGGSNVWSGPLTRVGQTRINVASGSTFVLAGGATGAGSLFVVNAYGSFILTEKPLLIGNTGFWADSTGLTVLAVAGNSWADTTFGRGTLRTDVPHAFPPATRLRFGLDYGPSGTLDLNGHDQTLGQLFTYTTKAGHRVITSAAPATLTLNASADGTFDGAFSNHVSLVKAGTGTLTLTANHTCTAGGFTVSNGTLAAASPGSLDGGPVTVAGGTLRNAVAAPAALRVAALEWHASGVLGLTLNPDGGCSPLAVAGSFTRGTGDDFTFDFSGSGAPGHTYALLTFGSTDFTSDAFRARNLGANPAAGLQGAFRIEGNTLLVTTGFNPAMRLLLK